jgi:hypothetical protein
MKKKIENLKGREKGPARILPLETKNDCAGEDQ